MSCRVAIGRSGARLVALALAVTCPGAMGATPAAAQSGAQGDTRPPLRLRLAYAPFYARQPAWFSRFECAARKAGGLLQAAVGRDLAIQDRTLWYPPAGEENPYTLRADLIRSVEPLGADIVVGLLPAGPPGIGARIVEDGLAAYSQGYVVLRVGTDLCASGALLAHEIAHIFGGVHRAGAGNLMDHAQPGEIIDALNAALFALHRDRRVREDPPPLRGPDLRMMWRLAPADLDDATTWLRVGVLAARMGKTETAAAHYEHALSLDPDLRPAWVNLGHARLQLAEFSAAEDAYGEALARFEEDGLVHNNLAVIYLSTSRPELAAAALQRAVALGFEVDELLREAVRKAGGGAPDSTEQQPHEVPHVD